MTIDTPKLNEVERKIAQGLTVFPRELLDAEMEVIESQVSQTRENFEEDFSGFSQWFILKLCSLAAKTLYFYFSIQRPATLRAYYREHSEGRFKEIVENRLVVYRSALNKLKDKHDAD